MDTSAHKIFVILSAARERRTWSIVLYQRGAGWDNSSSMVIFDVFGKMMEAN